jgi:hypothetical protein
MSDMLDTPMTDEMVFQCPRSKAFESPVTVQLSWAAFARQLEREIQASHTLTRELNERLRGDNRVLDDLFRSFSTTLKDLQEAKEALEWVLKEHGDYLRTVMEELNPPDMPLYLQKRLGKER